MEGGGSRSMARVGSKKVRAVRDDGKGEKDVMEKPRTRGRWEGRICSRNWEKEK